MHKGGSTYRNHDQHDARHNHQLEKREGAGASRVERRAPRAPQLSSLQARLSSLDPRLSTLVSGLSTEFHHRAMFDVMANMADNTLNKRKPTPSAITMIMAGSIRFVVTRNAIVNSFS